MLEGDRPGLRGFGRIGGAQHVEPGDRTQASQLFDRLMRRPIFADGDTIVREDVEHLQPAQCAEANGWFHVIGEHQKRRAEGQDPAVRGHPVDGRPHRMLAHAERYVTPGVAPYAVDRALNRRAARFGRLEIAFAFQCGIGGRVQIGRTAKKIVNALRQRVQYLTASRARRERLVLRIPFGQVCAPVVRQFSAAHLLEFGCFCRECLAIPVEPRLPVCLFLRALVADLPKEQDRFVGQKELFSAGPAERLFCRQQFFFSERTAVRFK